MRAVIQRVSSAKVTVEDAVIAEIKSGLLILLGIIPEDNHEDINWLSKKIANCRIFSDENGVMNNSIIQINGSALVVSQFTLHASIKKGHRPSYNLAAKSEIAIPIYENFIESLQLEIGKPVQTGEFGANMEVQLVNDGPVTIIYDSKNRV